MQREVQTVKLSHGYEADVVTYFTQGEKDEMQDLWANLADRVALHDKDGNEIGLTYHGGREYVKAARKLIYNTAVRALRKDGVALEGVDVYATIQGLPESCFIELKKAVDALTPKTEEEKKASTTA